MEQITEARDPVLASLGNQTARLIDAAVKGLGLELDVVLSVMACVMADYGSSNYGPDFLTGLAKVMKERAVAASTDRVQ